MKSQLWTKITDEVDKLFDMDEYDIIKFVATEDELVGRDYIHLFTTNDVSGISYHLCVKFDTRHILML